jgi:hypothetical protein
VRSSTRGVVPLSLAVELVLITFCGWALTRIAPSLDARLGMVRAMAESELQASTDAEHDEAKDNGRDRAVLARQRSVRRGGTGSSSPSSNSGFPASAAT